MTGQELIDYIQERELQDRHFFIDVEGYFSTIDNVMENERGDIILSQECRNVNDWKDDCYNRERYFSEWFDIIPFSDAKMLWEDGDRSFLVLASDGSDRYADCFESWEEIETTYPDALFGLEYVDDISSEDLKKWCNSAAGIDNNYESVVLRKEIRYLKNNEHLDISVSEVLNVYE